MQLQVVGIGREVYVFKTPASSYPRLNKGCVRIRTTRKSHLWQLSFHIICRRAGYGTCLTNSEIAHHCVSHHS